MAKSVIKQHNDSGIKLYKNRCNDLNVDINGLYQQGQRFVTQLVVGNASNSPNSSAGYYVLFIWDDPEYATQFYIAQNAQRMFIRFYNNGNWMSWTEFAKVS